MSQIPRNQRCEENVGFGLSGLLGLTQVAQGRKDALCPGQILFVSLQHWHLFNGGYFELGQM